MAGILSAYLPAESARGHVTHGFFVQQEFGSLDSGMGMKPLMHHAIGEKIGNRKEAHPLVVRHPAANQFKGMPPAMFARGGEVGRFIKTPSAQPPVVSHFAKVLKRGAGLRG